MFGGFLVCLLEEYQSSAVLPIRALQADIIFQNPGPLDAPVCGPHQSDGNPNFDVSARLRVGFPPLFVRRLDNLFGVSPASTPSSPST